MVVVEFTVVHPFEAPGTPLVPIAPFLDEMALLAVVGTKVVLDKLTEASMVDKLTRRPPVLAEKLIPTGKLAPLAVLLPIPKATVVILLLSGVAPP